MNDAWADYLNAAHRLDAVRREAASAAAAEAEAVAQARTELPIVQARLTIQAGRLLEAALDAGVNPPALVPGPVEERAAEHAVAGGPTVVLAALRQARSTVDVADAAIARIGERQAPQAIRNLVAYGPASLLALLIQLSFAFLVSESTRIVYAFLCGFAMAAMFWAAAWVSLGAIYPHKDKTPRFGAAVCALPIALVVLGFALFNAR